MNATLHPGVEPAVTALDDLHTGHPDAAEYADLLKSLNDLTGPCLLTTLGNLLDRLAAQAENLPGLATADRALIAEHLDHASCLLAPVGAAIDKARELTGEWTR